MAKRSASNSQFEIDFYEKVLKNSPDFIEALTCLGDLYTKQGLYEKGLRVDQRLALLRPEDATILYNLSCSYSLMGEVAAAHGAIQRAIVHGYDDLEYLQQDPDLINLLGNEEFRQYFSEICLLREKKSRKQEAA